MHVLITRKHSAKTILYERATEQDDLNELSSKLLIHFHQACWARELLDRGQRWHITARQKDSTENIPKLRVQVMSVDIKPLWANWILLSLLNYNWIWFSTFPNLIDKHKRRGTACSLHKKWGQPGTVGKTGSCAKQEAFDVFTLWLFARFHSFIFSSTLLP